MDYNKSLDTKNKLFLQNKFCSQLLVKWNLVSVNTHLNVRIPGENFDCCNNNDNNNRHFYSPVFLEILFQEILACTQ